MISIILFVMACLVWQRIKNALRGGRRKPEIKVRLPHLRWSTCGCAVREDRSGVYHVVKPCAAHRAILEIGA